jgi:hypothetical protein
MTMSGNFWIGLFQLLFFGLVLPGLACVVMVCALLFAAKAVSKSLQFVRRRGFMVGFALAGTAIVGLAIGIGIAMLLIRYYVVPLVEYT